MYGLLTKYICMESISKFVFWIYISLILNIFIENKSVCILVGLKLFIWISSIYQPK